MLGSRRGPEYVCWCPSYTPPPPLPRLARAHVGAPCLAVGPGPGVCVRRGGVVACGSRPGGACWFTEPHGACSRRSMGLDSANGGSAADQQLQEAVNRTNSSYVQLLQVSSIITCPVVNPRPHPVCHAFTVHQGKQRSIATRSKRPPRPVLAMELTPPCILRQRMLQDPSPTAPNPRTSHDGAILMRRNRTSRPNGHPPREEAASMARQTQQHAACSMQRRGCGCVEAGILTLFRGELAEGTVHILKEGEDTPTAPKVMFC